MGRKDMLGAVLDVIAARDLEVLIRGANEPPERLKDAKIKQLTRLLLAGEIDFELLVSPLNAFDLEAMCQEAGVDSGGLKSDRIRRLVDWFERENGDEVHEAISQQGQDDEAEPESLVARRLRRRTYS